MEVQIQIKNIERIIKAFQDAPDEMARGIDRAVQRLGVFMEGQTKKHITAGTGMWKPPIDTGAMRSGIYASFSPGQSIIRPSATTDYAEYVHEGTRFMRERPFFEIAADQEQGNLEKMLNDELDQIVNKITSKL